MTREPALPRVAAGGDLGEMDAESETRHRFSDPVQKSERIGAVDIDDRIAGMVLELDVDPEKTFPILST